MTDTRNLLLHVKDQLEVFADAAERDGRDQLAGHLKLAIAEAQRILFDMPPRGVPARTLSKVIKRIEQKRFD